MAGSLREARAAIRWRGGYAAPDRRRVPPVVDRFGGAVRGRTTGTAPRRARRSAGRTSPAASAGHPPMRDTPARTPASSARGRNPPRKARRRHGGPARRPSDSRCSRVRVVARAPSIRSRASRGRPRTAETGARDSGRRLDRDAGRSPTFVSMRGCWPARHSSALGAGMKRRRGSRPSLDEAQRPGRPIPTGARLQQSRDAVRDTSADVDEALAVVHARPVDGRSRTDVRLRRCRSTTPAPATRGWDSSNARSRCSSARSTLQEHRGAAGPYEQALGELGSTYLLMEDLARGVPYLTKALAVAEAGRSERRRCAVGEESRGRACARENSGTRRSASTAGDG